ncbi:YcxB family protein [Actinoplanes sp. NPDC051861]|uniref:YcxB family protein n=1 Tax=Actinoplanes sp. NPDC051861 TaxID=3155170 RepID=UPI0034384872
MHAIADLQLTYGLFRKMVLDTLGKSARRARIIGLVQLPLATVLGFAGGFDGRALLMIGVGVVLVVFPDLVAVLSWAPQRKILTTPLHYEISAAGVLIQTPSSRTEVAWPGISQIRTGKHSWLFKHGATQLPVPRVAFSADEQHSIEQFLAARPGLTPR